MTREHAWAPVGKRITGHVPRNRGVVLTVIASLTLNGIEALMTHVGGTSGEVFMRFVREHLVPTLRAGDLVVMDNLGAHHCTGVKEAIQAAGADVLYMPPYSPDLNPIELCWSKMKAQPKRARARTLPNLRNSIRAAAATVSQLDAEGWFLFCGYAVLCD